MHTSQCISTTYRYAGRIDIIAPMHKKTIHTVLAELIKKSGISPTELSRRAGVSQSTLSRILSRKIENPTDAQVHALAEYFGVTTDQLRGREPIMSLVTPSDSITSPDHPGLIPISAWGDDTPLDDDEVEVPFLREVELSAGSGKTVIEQSSKSKVRFGKHTLRNHHVQFDKAVCVIVSGNSMEPVLPDGSTVGVNTAATTITDGKMYAINHDGQLRVKVLYRQPGGGIKFRSYNTAEHEDEIYSAEDIQEKGISIIGRVFWAASFY